MLIAKDVHSELKRQYQNMHLLSLSEEWHISELKPLTKELLPSHISDKYINDFLQDIKKCVHSNSVLSDWVNSSPSRKCIKDISNVKILKSLLTESIAFGIALEKLTTAIHSHPELLHLIVKHYEKGRSKIPIIKRVNLAQIKYYSVAFAVKNIFINIIKNNKYSILLMKVVLMINILEVSLYELTKFHFKNSLTGMSLATETIKSVKHENNDILIDFENTQKWIDLYQSWDMAFVLGLNNFHLAIMKLLIPSVADYKNCPNCYLYKRVIALYLYINYAEYKRFENNKSSSATSINLDNYIKKWGDYNWKTTRMRA
jgi:hypothetical protein|tara:strand:- start:275 stop:1222 length:948 start_codon:yes stop_codon:yes gene_type:complete